MEGKMLKKLVKLMPRPIQRLMKQVINFRILARGYGQWTTIRDWNSVDKAGNPIPWYTYPATEYLSHLDFSVFSVFEYGSGNSTLWWAERAKSIVSVEDDKHWFQKIRGLASDNIEYLLETEKERYVHSSCSDTDIFIIDGKYRRECAEYIVGYTNGGVMIILDNSDWHPNTVDYLHK
jgi:hypothetical protein